MPTTDEQYDQALRTAGRALWACESGQPPIWVSATTPEPDDPRDDDLLLVLDACERWGTPAEIDDAAQAIARRLRLVLAGPAALAAWDATGLPPATDPDIARAVRLARALDPDLDDADPLASEPLAIAWAVALGFQADARRGIVASMIAADLIHQGDLAGFIVGTRIGRALADLATQRFPGDDPAAAA